MTTSFDLNQFLPYRIARAAQRISTDLAGLYGAPPYSLSTPQWRILAHLGQNGSAQPKQLAELTGLDKVQISRAAKGLLERGVLKRQPDPDDKRAQLLQLSDLGRRLYRQLAPKAQQWEADLLEDWSTKDKQALVALLSKLEQGPQD